MYAGIIICCWVIVGQPLKSGINGYIVHKRDPESIADAVLKIYDGDRCKTMGNISQKLVKNYSFKSIAEKAIEIYKNLAKK
jgi:glycosyltransferase involved in cell wall biosynthesis